MKLPRLIFLCLGLSALNSQLPAQVPISDLSVQRTVILGNGTTSGKAGTISPAQLTANTDDWAPTGFAYCFAIRVSTDASRNLTGVAGGVAGRTITLENVGSFPLVLKNDVTSTAANRFKFAGDYTLGAGVGVMLKYDGTSSRWRLLGAQTSATGTVTHSGGALTANLFVLGAGTDDTKVAAGLGTDGTSKVILGVEGASVGSIDFKNATSGTVNMAPPTGALGTVSVVLPLGGTLATLAGTETFTNKSMSGSTNTFTNLPAAGSTTHVQYNSSGVFAGSANFTYASSVLGLINGLAANTSGDSLTVSNTSTASSGNQMYSPRLVLAGQGWKTTATAASQDVRFGMEVRPVQGTTNPTGQFIIGSNVNAAGYTDRLVLTTAGFFGIGTTNGVPDVLMRIQSATGADANVSIEAPSRSQGSTIGVYQKSSASRDYGAYFYAEITTSDFVIQAREANTDFEVYRVSNSTRVTTFAIATDATSSTAAAVKMTGGLAVAKKLYVGSTTDATTSSAGAVVLSGGLAVAKKIITADSITTAAPSGGTAAAWKFGTVATVSPTAQNRTIELDVAGTRYFLSAKTTND